MDTQQGEDDVAVDYESYYDNDCSITKGADNYFNHPDFDAYMVSVYSKDIAWVGHPNDAPWEQIKGRRWLSHNRSFDEPLHTHLGLPQPKDWQCTADLAAYHAVPRSLAMSSKYVLGVPVSKDTRDNMKGKKWAEMTPEFQKEVAAYALKDSKLCYELWQKLGSNWPEWERNLSRETTRMCRAGFPANKQKMDDAIDHLQVLIHQCREAIPWHGDEADLSPIAWAEWVRSRGKEPPATMAKDDPETIAWTEANPEEGSILGATWNIRGANAMLKKLESMRMRVRSDGMLPFGMKYFGAMLTGRDSGDSGFNVQNMPRNPMYGVFMRGMVEAREGHKLLVADLGQIEARAIAWLAGDKEALEYARLDPEADWYRASAKSMGIFDEAEWDQQRQMIKGLFLGCQFGMGANRFADVAKVSPSEAQRLINLYRDRNPKIKRLWQSLKNHFITAAHTKQEEFTIELPSGRKLNYRKPETRNGMKALLPRGKDMAWTKIWHGFLAENTTQALARDVFMDRVLELNRRGIFPNLRVHDEIVVEVKDEDVPEVKKEIKEAMSTPPAWVPTLPITTDVEVMQSYRK